MRGFEGFFSLVVSSAFLTLLVCPEVKSCSRFDTFELSVIPVRVKIRGFRKPSKIFGSMSGEKGGSVAESDKMDCNLPSLQ